MGGTWQGRKVVLATATAFALSLLGLGTVLHATQRDGREDVEQRAQERAEIAAALIGSTLVSVTDDGSDSQRLLGGAHIRTPDLRRLAGSMGLNTIRVVEGHGRVIASWPDAGELGRQESGRYIREALDGRASISDIHGEGAAAVMTLAMPVRGPEGNRAALLDFPLLFGATFLKGYLERVRNVPGGSAAVIDGHARVVASADASIELGSSVDDARLIEAMRGRGHGTYERADGTEMYFAARDVEIGGWRVVFWAPSSRLAAAASGTPSWVVWLLFGAFALTAAACVALIRRGQLRAREIQAATEAKTRFLASMSHELRTPLNGIIGFAELMHDGKLGPMSADHREYMGDILSSARHLHRLIDDVLDIAKVEAGRMGFTPEAVDLSLLIAGALDGQRAVADGNGVALEHSVDPAVRHVTLDPARFTQVLLNYVSNALKFTPPNGQVTVHVGPQGATGLRLEVRDTGLGIPLDEQDRLFKEFEQLAGSREHGGTGLGLALTKRIVEEQGGSVGVDSQPGRGSCFHAVLPLELASAEAVAA